MKKNLESLVLLIKKNSWEKCKTKTIDKCHKVYIKIEVNFIYFYSKKYFD